MTSGLSQHYPAIAGGIEQVTGTLTLDTGLRELHTLVASIKSTDPAITGNNVSWYEIDDGKPTRKIGLRVETSATPAIKATGLITCPAKSEFLDGQTLTIDDNINPAIVFEFDTDGVGLGVCATGSITAVAKAALVDGQTFTLNDGTNPATVFEFDVAGDGVAGGNIQVNVSTDTSAEDVAARMRTAINGVVGGLAITAAAGTTAVVSLKNDAVGVAGNVAITDTVLDAGFVVAGMSGGVDAVSSRVRVNISASVTAGDVRDALLAQISAQDLAIAAVTSGAASIALTHLVAGTVGNKAMSDTVVSAGFTTSGMSGGAETVDGAALSSSPVWVSWFALGK